MEAVLQVIPWKEILTLLALVFYVESATLVLTYVKQFRTSDQAKKRIGVFAVAWLIVGFADYGVLQRIIQVGVNAKYGLASIDYFCTAAFITRLSGLTYDKIEAVLEKINTKKQQARMAVTKAE